MAMHQCYWRLLQHPARTHRARCQHIHPLAIPSSVPPLSHSSHHPNQCSLTKNLKLWAPAGAKEAWLMLLCHCLNPLYNTTINLPPLCLLSHTQNRCQTKSCPYTLTQRSLNHRASKELTQSNNAACNVNPGLKPRSYLHIY